MRARREVVVQLVDQRRPDGNVELDDVVVGDVVESLNSAHKLAVRADDQATAGADLRMDALGRPYDNRQPVAKVEVEPNHF